VLQSVHRICPYRLFGGRRLIWNLEWLSARVYGRFGDSWWMGLGAVSFQSQMFDSSSCLYVRTIGGTPSALLALQTGWLSRPLAHSATGLQPKAAVEYLCEPRSRDPATSPSCEETSVEDRILPLSCHMPPYIVIVYAQARSLFRAAMWIWGCLCVWRVSATLGVVRARWTRLRDWLCCRLIDMFSIT
jgi:hypothetical protein